MSDFTTRSARARAHSNIALIKYWGKRDARLNLPAVGSISITLDALYTDTHVEWMNDQPEDIARIGDAVGTDERLSRFLDLVRARAGIHHRARVDSDNNFPTGAGLASSASGFAALALAATRAAGLEMSPSELSALARRGSGSAARSVYGGFVEMYKGERENGADARAEPLLGADAWPLAVVIAVTETRAKTVDSTVGMTRTAQASPFFDTWVRDADDDLAAMRNAIAARDLAAVGELAEFSCLKMHALMMSTRPGLIYWNAATLAAMHAVRELRGDGLDVYFTIDAGPQVKALCAPEHAATVAHALQRVAGVYEARISALGPDAHLR